MPRPGTTSRRTWWGAGGRATRVAGVVAALAASCGAVAQPDPQNNPVYVDEWATATESFLSLPLQLSSGNLESAVRVLQKLLDEEAAASAGSGGTGRVIELPDEPDLFSAVRTRVHQTLLGNPALLARYREAEGPRAQHLLADQNNPALVEQTRLLTAAGFEAALRLAQSHLESARFNAAWHTLRQLDEHPDRRGGAGAGDAVDLLERTARFLNRADVREMASRWAKEAGRQPEDGRTEVWPAVALRRGMTPLDAAPAVTLQGMVARPLWTVSLGTGALGPIGSENSGRGGPGRGEAINPADQAPAGARLLWVFPSSAGDTVFANDGATIWAWDRFTLSKRWSTTPALEPRAEPEGRRIRGITRPRGWSQGIEDPSAVTVSGRDLVTITGVAVDSRRENEAIHALDADTGRVRWSVRLDDLDPSLSSSNMTLVSVRGAPMVGEGVVVLAVRKVSQNQRLTSLYLLGLNLSDGGLKWKRLVGSAGSLPYYSGAALVDGATMAEGVVYRLDQLGVIAAYEAQTGRPVWVRRSDATPLSPQGGSRPWEVNQPIVDGGTLIAVGTDRRAVLRLDRATGRLLGARSAADFSTPAPDYVLRVGEMLASVGPTRIALAGLSDFDKLGSPIRQIARLTDPGIRGRVVVSGNRLIVPTAGGVAVIDPADGAGRVEPVVLEKPGNILVLPSQLLVADDAHVHSYLLWDEAERVLRQRMQADPSDPGPAATFAELAYRAGRPEMILPAVDVAVQAINAAGGESTVVDAARRRLIDALLAMVNASQEPDARPVAVPGIEGASAPSGRLTDVQLLGLLIDRLGKVATTADDRASHLLALGRHRESRTDGRGAVETYQRILADPALAAATWSGPQVSLRAELEATWRLERLIQDQGPGVYGVYEAQAREQLAALGPAATEAELEGVVRRFPVAAVVPGAWLRIARLQEAGGRPQLAVGALEAGLRAGIRRADTDGALLGELGGRLVRAMEGRGQLSAATVVIRQVQARAPGAVLTDGSTAMDGAAILGDLSRRLAESNRWPRVGQVSAEGVQAVAGWTLMRPLRRDITGHTARCLVMENGEEIGVWACTANAGAGGCDGELTKVWSMPTAGADASLLCVRGDTAFFYLDAPSGGTVMAVSAPRGEAIWKSEPFPSLFRPDPAAGPAAGGGGGGGGGGGAAAQAREAPGLIATPIDGPVAANSLIWSLDERTVVLIDRTGRAAGLDAQTGQVLWAIRTPVSRVFDTDLRDGVLVVAGDQDATADAAGPAGPASIAAVIDARTGQITQRIVSAHGQFRWVNLTESGALVAGLDRAIASFDPLRGQVNWATAEPTLMSSQQAWVFGDRLFVSASETPIRAMWSMAIRDGRAGATPVRIPSEHMDASQPMYAALVKGVRGHDAVAFTTMHGVVVVSMTGDVLGVDALGGIDALIPAQAGDGVLVTAETVASARQSDGQMDFALHVLDGATARIVQTRSVVLGARPRRLALLDGRVAITAGGSTVILRATEK